MTKYTHGIIIPFRKRDQHLSKSAPILAKYGKLFVIEQKDDKPFNRGKLINVGYLQFKQQFDYFTIHDVDLIPQNGVNYSYSEIPVHLAAEVEHLNYHLPYEKYFGGVTLVPNDKFEKINGFPNDFWGWGAEDDELRRRFVEMNIDVIRRQCRFSSLPHIRKINPELRAANKKQTKEPVKWGNGLTSCYYEIISCREFSNYTLLQVKL